MFTVSAPKVLRASLNVKTLGFLGTSIFVKSVSTLVSVFEVFTSIGVFTPITVGTDHGASHRTDTGVTLVSISFKIHVVPLYSHHTYLSKNSSRCLSQSNTDHIGGNHGDTGDDGALVAISATVRSQPNVRCGISISLPLVTVCMIAGFGFTFTLNCSPCKRVTGVHESAPNI